MIAPHAQPLPAATHDGHTESEKRARFVALPRLLNAAACDLRPVAYRVAIALCAVLPPSAEGEISSLALAELCAIPTSSARRGLGEIRDAGIASIDPPSADGVYGVTLLPEVERIEHAGKVPPWPGGFVKLPRSVALLACRSRLGPVDAIVFGRVASAIAVGQRFLSAGQIGKEIRRERTHVARALRRLDQFGLLRRERVVDRFRVERTPRLAWGTR